MFPIVVSLVTLVTFTGAFIGIHLDMKDNRMTPNTSDRNYSNSKEEKPMKELIEEYLDNYIESNNLSLTEEEYRSAYKGVEYWLTTNLPDAASDAVTSAV